MVAHYNASHITLHVRKSNRAAISLYRDTLGFTVFCMEKGYCGSPSIRTAHGLICAAILSLTFRRARLLTTDADGEDAYGMRFDFRDKKQSGEGEKA